MILHTIFPLSQVLYDTDLDKTAAMRYMPCAQGLLEIGRGQIVNRVISTDPKAFLNPCYAPGMPLPKPDKPFFK